MSPRTKSWVKGLRRFQLALRVLQLIAAAGLLTLWILFDKLDTITGWVMRVTVCHSLIGVHGVLDLEANYSRSAPLSWLTVCMPSTILHATLPIELRGPPLPTPSLRLFPI